MSKHIVSPDENRDHAQRIREEIARQRLSRETLADRARISLSTLEKGLSGQRPFTLATLVRIETALGFMLRTGGPSDARNFVSSGNAPDDLKSASGEIYVAAKRRAVQRSLLSPRYNMV